MLNELEREALRAVSEALVQIRLQVRAMCEASKDQDREQIREAIRHTAETWHYFPMLVAKVSPSALNPGEGDALLATSEALMRIRKLATANQDPQSIGPKLVAIHDLADAFHNIPRIVAEGSRMQFLIKAGLEAGARVPLLP